MLGGTQLDECYDAFLPVPGREYAHRPFPAQRFAVLCVRERALASRSKATSWNGRLELNFHAALLRLAQSVARGGNGQSALVPDDD
jgi:hypothetical protein